MRTVHFRSISLVAAAVLTLTASVAAQDRPSGLLNNLEVRQLVARGEPGDQAQLSAHFTKRYTVEANEHVALAQAYRGTRIAQAAVHHDRLAGLSGDGAKEATAAAEMHKQLAGIGR
jgi:hypothetical protein